MIQGCGLEQINHTPVSDLQHKNIWIAQIGLDELFIKRKKNLKLGVRNGRGDVRGGRRNMVLRIKIPCTDAGNFPKIHKRCLKQISVNLFLVGKFCEEQLSLFNCGCPRASEPFIEKTVFPPWNCVNLYSPKENTDTVGQQSINGQSVMIYCAF